MAQLAKRTETEIANRALSHIKKGRLSSIDEDQGNTADTVRLHFASVRDALLRQYPWNFAEDFDALPQLACAPPGFGFKYFYQLPENCLWVREVRDCGRDQWRVLSQRRIASDAGAPLRIRFTKRVVEVPYWDAMFADVMAMHLAVAIGPPLVTDEDILTAVKNAAAEMLLAAYPSDAAESGAQSLPNTSWVTRR